MVNCKKGSKDVQCTCKVDMCRGFQINLFTYGSMYDNHRLLINDFQKRISVASTKSQEIDK